MLTRDEVKAYVDKVINMAKADAVEVNLSASERSGTRWADSSITGNLVQYNRTMSVTVRLGQRTGSSTSRDWSDKGLQEMVAEARSRAEAAEESRTPLPELLGAQTYLPVDGAPTEIINLGPAERARMVRASIDMASSLGVLAAGYIPKVDTASCQANSAGLFAYFRNAEINFSLTCRTPDGTGSGWSGVMGVKDLSYVDAAALTRQAGEKARRSVGAKALEPGRYTVILEPRASARFLSLATGVFSGGGGGRGGAGGPGAGAGGPPAGAGAGAGAGGTGRGGGTPGRQIGDKIFSDAFTLKSDVGNQILRQNPIGGNNRPLGPVTWCENGVLKNFTANQPASTSNSLVQVGTDLSIEDMIRQTRRGLLVTQLWYIRGVPSQTQPMLSTGMTRDGLFLIENGEIAGPVQNFRWNMSPLVGYNNLTLVGRPVPMGMGEASDISSAALVPPVRIEEFYMTSISPAV